MSTLDSTVTSHYGDDRLLVRILAGLRDAGIDLDDICPDDLAPIEEFHTGGRQATMHVVDSMGLHDAQHVLDVGCGIGGAVRYIAAKVGCRVTGLDLTPEYIAVAKLLTELTGLEAGVSYDIASALDMPYATATFDAAISLHVAMNIPDRERLYAEIARVLKPGATLCLFDLMQRRDEPLTFPVPWAVSPDCSYLVTPEAMQLFLEAAGFQVRAVSDRTDFALSFFRNAMNAAKDSQPLGLHLVMGESAGERLRNAAHNIERGRIAPVQMLATRL